MLGKKLRNGKILVTDITKIIWESYSVFTKHKLDNFCTSLDRLKAEGDKKEGTFIYLWNDFYNNVYLKYF